MPNIVEYRMTRVQFGTTASPLLLTATLQHHFNHADSVLRSTAAKLAENFYVDDLVTGASSCIYQEANLILSKAIMKLQKWCTSDDELRQRMANGLDFGSAAPLRRF